jgi:hypothetical protein
MVRLGGEGEIREIGVAGPAVQDQVADTPEPGEIVPQRGDRGLGKPDIDGEPGDESGQIERDTQARTDGDPPLVEPIAVLPHVPLPF